MSGTFPTSPKPQSVSLRSVTPAYVSTTHSLQRQVRSRGGQRYMLTASFPPMTRATAAPVLAFLMKQQGPYETFTFSVPEHDALGVATGSPVVIERQNLVEHASDFSETGSWTTTDLTQGSSTTAPDGANDAQLWTSTSGAAGHHRHDTDVSLTVAAHNVISCYMKENTSARTIINMRDETDSISHFVKGFWYSGVLVYSSQSNIDAYGFENIGSGWYRFWAYWNASAEIGNALCCYYYPIDTNETGNVGSYMWGAQFEHGLYQGRTEPGPLYETTTAAQSGESNTARKLYTDGWTDSTNDIIKAGSLFTLAGQNKVYQVVADADSDGNGCATLTIEPALISSPADGEALTITDVPFTVSLASDLSQFDINSMILYGFSIDMIEVP